MGARIWKLTSLALRAVAIVLLLSQSTSCTSDQGRRVTTAAIAVSGTIVHGLVQANRDIYVHATDAIRAHAQGPDYTREVAPINLVFEARSRALQALSADLYAAAAMVDATRGTDGGLSAYADVARTLIDAIERDIAVLREGAVLPAVPIPQAIDGILTTLRGIAGIAGGH